jgi:hypothetical protein
MEKLHGFIHSQNSIPRNRRPPQRSLPTRVGHSATSLISPGSASLRLAHFVMAIGDDPRIEGLAQQVSKRSQRVVIFADNGNLVFAEAF